jgi:hypothetical protein
MNRFPRTTGEFLENGRGVALRCECGATTWLKPENLIQRLGREFDLYAGFAELIATFPCDACGKEQQISFTDTGRKSFVPVSFDQSTIYSLELSAFALARDAAELGISQAELQRRRREQSTGRWRKFGPNR